MVELLEDSAIEREEAPLMDDCATSRLCFETPTNLALEAVSYTHLKLPTTPYV